MDGVFLSPSEDEFVGRIVEELEHFMEQGQHHRVLLFPPLSSRLRYLIHRTVEGMELLSSFSVGEGWRRRTVICHSAVRLPNETSSDPKPGANPARAQRPAQPWGRGGRGARLRHPGDPHGDGGRASVGSGRIGRPARRKPEKAPYVPRGTRRKENWRERDGPGDGEAAPGGENCAGNSVRDPGSAGERLEPDPGKGGAERPPCEEKEASSGNGGDSRGQEGRDGDCSRCPGSAHTEQRPGEPGQGQGGSTGTAPEGSEPQGEQRSGRDPAGPEGGSGSEPLEKHGDRWTEPGVTEPGVTEPGVTEPGVTEPGVTEPSVTEPGVTEPGVTAPGVTEPGVTEPGVTEPGVTAPSVTAPGVTEPGVTEPGVTEPGGTAGVTEPGVTEPGVTEPGVTAPGVTEPGVTDLPITALAVTEPGVTAPGVTDLPVTDLPVTEPGVTEPGMTAPGVTEPGVPAPPVPVPGVTSPPVPAPPVAAPPALGSRPERSCRSPAPPAQPDSRDPEGGRAAPAQGSPSAGQGQQKPPQKVLEGPAEALAAPELLHGGEPGRIHGGKEEEEDEEGSGAWRGPDLAAGDREGTRQSGLEDECTAELLAEIVGNLRLKEISIERVSVAGPGCGEGELGHVTEIYDFAPSLRTEDLLELFADFHEGGFRIQWVDETHALGIFGSASAASQALGRRYPCLKLRPLLHGSRQAKLKALQRPKLLQLGKERPQTDAAVARRLVSHALGWRHRLQGAEDSQAEPLEQQE